MARQAPTQEIVVRPSWALPRALLLLGAVAGIAFAAYSSASWPGMGGSTPLRPGEVIARLAGDGAPHPAGSPANAAVRERIVAELKRSGYAPEIQAAPVCARGVCAQVQNIVARLAGSRPGRAVLVMAHYDSVGAGPGVGDDLTGVAAILEVARVLKAGPPPANDVLFLLDEGEELGLLGARAFAEHDKAAASVGAIVNLDARGTAGPSMMFETAGRNDDWLVPLFAKGAPAPVSSSLFSFIYHQMPNDTDLTVWKDRGVPGLNFAFIGNPQLYHSSLDNIARLAPDTARHQADNALAAVRALAAADLASPPTGPAYWFDLLRLFIVRWGQGIHLALGLLAGGLSLGVAILALKRGTVRGGAFTRGLLAFPLVVVATAAVAIGLRFLLSRAFPAPWVAHAAPAQVAFWLLAPAVGLGLALWLARRSSFGGLWLGVWTWWALLAVVLTWLAGGTAYLFQIPALVAALAGLVLFRGPEPDGARRGIVVLLPLAAAALVWFPALSSLYRGLGAIALPLVSVLLSIVTAALLPFVTETSRQLRKALVLSLWGGVVVAAAIAVTRAPFSPELPQAFNIQVYRDADSGQVRFFARGYPLPPSIAQAAAFGAQPVVPFPWSPPQSRLFAAPGPALPTLVPPEVRVEKDEIVDGHRHLVLRLISPRGALVAFLALAPGTAVRSAAVDGVAVQVPALDPQSYFRLIDVTLPPEGAALDLVLDGTGRINGYAVDQSSGLPPEAQALAAARPVWAVPNQEGDTTVVSRKVDL